MSQYSRSIFCCLILGSINLLNLFGQSCELTIHGSVLDLGSQEPLHHVHILVEETGNGAVSDDDGVYHLYDLCPGSYHLQFTHIGCESQRIFAVLNQDTIIDVEMDHSSHVIGGVTVSDERQQTIEPTAKITTRTISDQAQKPLAAIIDAVPGVRSLKNGGSIQKPIVHGLYGNRLTILNNGIALSGQQWGNDHSPEIDPLSANVIEVIKGVATLEYPMSNLGSLVLMSPGKINKEPHVHGSLGYVYESNGRRHGSHVQLQQHHPTLAWRINGTLRRGGDLQTPDYFLNNTGSSEANASLQLEKQWNGSLFSELYISSFNTELGVLRGSHIGNLTDLNIAFNREIPFFTEDDFSYNIDAPYQLVNHHLAKLSNKYFVNDNRWLELNGAIQINRRREFDVRRVGRSEIPALYLDQLTNYLELKHTSENDNGIMLKSGAQFNFVKNNNDPQTGILPLIPNYASSEFATFYAVNRQLTRWSYELGAKYQLVYQNVAAISQNITREIIKFENYFHNISASAGANVKLNERLSTSFNLGYASRNPAINELYSFGLHQGVSGIEEGDPELEVENAIKSTLSVSLGVTDKFSVEVLGYYQLIDDYIYLQPQDEIRLTIRGAFPVFRYEQTDAAIYGADLSTHYDLSESTSIKLDYSYIRGQDLDQGLGIVNIPSNDLRANLKHEWHFHNSSSFENLELEIGYQYIFEQTNILPSQDFTPPPDGYQLTSMNLATNWQMRSTRWRMILTVDNLFNIRYRDYLNRLRYYADDLGRNISLGVKVKI